MATVLVLKSIYAGVGFILLGFFAFVLHFLTPKHSEKGRDLHRQLTGFYNFLKDPAPDELNELLEKEPNYLNRMFPYALAFGLDQNWAERFKDLFVKPPVWYDHPSMYTAQGLKRCAGQRET